MVPIWRRKEFCHTEKSPRNRSVWYFSSKLDVPSNIVQKKRVAQILVFKIRSSQEILKIRDGTPLEAEGILTYRKRPSKLLEKSPRNCSIWHFSSKLDVPSNVVQKERVAWILVFKIRPSQKILKIRDGTPLKAEGILTYRKSPRNCSFWHFSSKLDIPSNVVQKKRLARILVFKIRSSQEILKIRDGTPLEAEEILTYRKALDTARFGTFLLDVPSNVVQKERVAWILVFKIRPSQKILKIRDGTPLKAEGILTYRKSPRNCSFWHFSSKLDIPSNVVQKKRLARILVFKIRSSQEILKIRDGTPLEAEEILTYRKALDTARFGTFLIKSPRNCSIWHFSSKLDVPSNVVQKQRVAWILVFKIRPSQKILKIRDGTPLKAEGILTYRKSPRNCLFWNFSSKLDVPSNVVQKKRLAWILVFKIRSSQEILKIRDGTPLEAEEILTYRKALDTARFGTFLLDVPSNVVQKERVAWILVFKIRPSQKILKIRDGTPLKAEGILTYRKSPRNCSFWHFSSKLDVPSNVVQKKRLARILVFKIRSSQEILKIRDGTPLEAEEILTYRKALDTARFGTFLVRPSQEILKIRDGTPLEAEGILTHRKSPRNCSVWHFSSKLDVPSNVVQKKRVERILVFKIRPSQNVLKIHDGTPFGDVPSDVVQKKRVARILLFKIRPSKEILKICDGTPLEAEGILTYRKSPRNCSVWHFSSKLDVPGNIVQKEIVARILVFKIRPSQKILKIRDGTPLEAEEILTYRKALDTARIGTFLLDVPSNVVQKERVAWILVFKIRPSQKILKIRDGTPLKAEGILTYRKSPRNCSFWHFSSKLDVPSNVVQKKRLARILVFKIRSSQEILKIRDGTPLEAEEILTYRKALDTARFGTFLVRPSQKILKIRDGTPLEAEGILTHRKSPRNCSVWHFSSNLDVPSNVVQKKRVERILVFKIRPSQNVLKIHDGTPLELDVPSDVVQKKRVARILLFKIRPSKEILKICDGTPLEAEGILTYRKSPRNCSVWHFSSKLDVPGNIVQKEIVARILVFKIRPSQKILKIRDGTPLEAEEILTYRKALDTARIGTFLMSSQEILKIRDEILKIRDVARILVFKIMPSKEILKVRDGTPLEAEGILTYRKSPRNCSVWHFFSKLYVPCNVVQKKEWHGFWFSKLGHLKKFLKFVMVPFGVQKERVARILVFKIRPSQKILKIRDGTPLEAEEILTYRKALDTARIGTFLEYCHTEKSPRNRSIWHFSSKLDVPSNVVQKKRVAHILVFKIRSSQEILKIRDGTPLEKKRVARILIFKIRPSQEILKICDGTPLEAEEILTYRKALDTARFGTFLWPSKEILKIRDGTPLEAEGILTYRKKPPKLIGLALFSKLYVPTNKERVARILVFKIRPSQKILKIRDVQKKRLARILVFKIRSSQEILKIRDGTPLEAEEILTYRKALDTARFGTFLAEGILTYRKSPRNCSVWHFFSKLDVPGNIVQKERVARILVFKIRPSQKILKIRDGTPLEAEEILTYRKAFDTARIGTFLIWHFSSKIDVPSNVVQKERVARILVFKIRPSQKILKIRDGTPLKAEGILTYRKSPRNYSFWHFSSKLDVPSNVVQKKRLARILVSKLGHLKKF
ncbi:hypothetical protein OROMI_024526 [Orobanche minor]